MPVTGRSSITMGLNDYRGLSAYEIALKNGFEGTESEWLKSLKGAKGDDGDRITVNHKKAVDGNISVNATDIQMQPGVANETVAKAIAQRIKTSDVIDDLNSEDPTKPLSAAQGKALYALAAAKAQAVTQLVQLPLDGWTEDGELYSQTVSVAGATADVNLTSIFASPPNDRTLEEIYLECAVRASAQGDGTLTFTCTELPDVDLESVVTVIVLGVKNLDS